MKKQMKMNHQIQQKIMNKSIVNIINKKYIKKKLNLYVLWLKQDHIKI